MWTEENLRGAARRHALAQGLGPGPGPTPEESFLAGARYALLGGAGKEGGRPWRDSL